MKKIIALLLVLCSFSAFIFAEDVPMSALTLGSTRSNGFGGPHVAYTNDIYSLFVNPAALMWSNQGSILEISAALTGPLDKLLEDDNLKTLMDTVKSMGGDSGDMGDSLKSLSAIMPDGRMPIGLNMRGPISMGYTANGLGLGLFSNISVDASVVGEGIDAKVYGDVMFNFGMAFNILRLKNHEVSAGFVLKPFARVMGELGLKATSLVGGGDAMDALLDDVAIPLIAGGGADLGLQYRWREDLVVGFAVNDVYTAGVKVYDIYGVSNPDVLYRVKPAYNVGLSYTFRLSKAWESAPKALQSFYIAGMADWHNIQNVFTWDDFSHRNPILDISAGAELGLFNFLKLRVGLNEMLPSVGFGFEPGFFKLNFALYGKELGNEPGQLTTMAAEFSLAFRPNTKKKSFGFAQPIIK
jgi:hypothetical protein